MSMQIVVTPREFDGERLYSVEGEPNADIVRGIVGAGTVSEQQLGDVIQFLLELPSE